MHFNVLLLRIYIREISSYYFDASYLFLNVENVNKYFEAVVDQCSDQNRQKNLLSGI